jgi:hypothetical protein
MEQPPPEDGYRRAHPRLPTGIVVASVIIALVAVSGLIALLYRETRGPGEILREFARHVDEGDCESSYDLLDASVQGQLDESAWCESLAQVDRVIDAGFDVEQAILRRDQAEVHVSGPAVEVWLLRRFGERSWRVVGPPGGF